MQNKKLALVLPIIALATTIALTGCTTSQEIPIATNQKIPIANATSNTTEHLQSQTQAITPKYITELDAYRNGDLYKVSFKLASENNQEITESKPPLMDVQITIKDSINNTVYNGTITLTALHYDSILGYMFVIPVEDIQPSKTPDTSGTLYLKIRVSDKTQLNKSNYISSLPTLSDEQIIQYWEQKYQETAKSKQVTTQVGNIKITATKAGPWDTIDFSLLGGPVKKYYRVDLKIENTGNTIEYPISSCKLVINGKEYEDKAFLVLPSDQEDCSLLSIAPEVTKTCTLLFPRPQETSGTAKIYLGTKYNIYTGEQPIVLTFQYP